MKRLFGSALITLVASALQAQINSPTPADLSNAETATAAAAASASCLACGGGFFILIIAIIVLSIALLVWVARDAKNRGMDNAVMWMILVFFTNLLGLIIYIFSRPQGNLVPCPSCKNKRLEASAKCPHCGNP